MKHALLIGLLGSFLLLNACTPKVTAPPSKTPKQITKQKLILDMNGAAGNIWATNYCKFLYSTLAKGAIENPSSPLEKAEIFIKRVAPQKQCVKLIKPIFLANLQNKATSLPNTISLNKAGEVVEKSLKSAGLNYLDYYVRLGGLLPKAEKHNAEAEYKLHTLYRVDRPGIQKNMNKSFYWLNRAHEDGDKDATADLASYYAKGLGTPKNIKKAHELYAETANNGDPYAMYNIGLGYFKGQEGYPKDFAKSLPWLKKSAAKGIPCADHDLGLIYKTGGNGVKANSETAKTWFKKAYKNGTSIGMIEGTSITKAQYADYMLGKNKNKQAQSANQQLEKICWS